jgi:DNA-binding transcriptional ArsR family regulator/uncharacterized protein YndB with AHSA1/START domain
MFVVTYESDEAWAVLADRSRRAIVTELAREDLTVTELTDLLPISQPAVSQHLKVLKQVGMVTDRAEGTRRRYRLNEAGVAVLRDQLDAFWRNTLSNFEQHMEETMTDESAVRRHVVVKGSPERAFAAFTDRFDAVKPREHNLLGAPIAETILEPRVGGRIVDRAEDGTECAWARVLAFEPPHRIVFTWDIGPTWQLETDPANASEVEIRFVAEGSDSTRVELEHRHLDRHGAGWMSLRDGIAGDQGWPLYLNRFVALMVSSGSGTV